MKLERLEAGYIYYINNVRYQGWCSLPKISVGNIYYLEKTYGSNEREGHKTIAVFREVHKDQTLSDMEYHVDINWWYNQLTIDDVDVISKATTTTTIKLID